MSVKPGQVHTMLFALRGHISRRGGGSREVPPAGLEPATLKLDLRGVHLDLDQAVYRSNATEQLSAKPRPVSARRGTRTPGPRLGLGLAAAGRARATMRPVFSLVARGEGTQGRRWCL